MLLAGIAALVYLLLCCRIQVDARVRSEGGVVHACVFLRAVGISLLLDYSGRSGVSGEGLRVQWAAVRRYGSLLRAAGRSLRFGQTDIRAVLGLGDAAQSALVSGAVQAILLSACAMLGQGNRTDVRILPDFSRKRLAASVRCIFSIIPGDLIFAVAKEAVKKTQREGFKWLSTPLKA